MSRKIFVTILLVFLVTIMVLPNAFAEDGVMLTANNNGNQPPSLPEGENMDVASFEANQSPEIPTGNLLASSVTENTQLNGINLTKVYGSDEEFKVTFTDNNGNVIVGQHISINLTRTSNGASKVYDAVTDYLGIAALPINLAPGVYTSFTSYTPINEFNYTYAETFNTITIIRAGETPTVLSASPFIEVEGAGESFNVTLTNLDGTPIAGRHIRLNLTRISSGANKVYDSTTDYLGIASLQINLGKGNYTVSGTYKGEDQYAGSYISTTITIVEKTDSNTTPPDVPGNGTVPPDGPGNGTTPPDVPGGDNGTVPDVPNTNTTSDNLVVNGDNIVLSGTDTKKIVYSSATSDSNAVIVANGGNLTISDVTIAKTGDVSSSNSESSDFYGTNAAILVLADSSLNISDATIITTATGANAIFVTNSATGSSGAIAYVSNVDISTYRDKSRGLDATYGGIIIADNVTINTRGGSCAALATDRGEGTVTATNSVLNTGVDSSQNIAGSPIIYSTGDITAINCTGTAYQSQIACIEGKNSITLDNCDLTGYAKGNRESNGAYVDLGGIFIYQSMSGDADVGIATLNASNSILTIASDSAYASTAPMFHITNTEAIINLNNCTLNFNSGILLNASGQDQWGTSGSNGGKVVFTANNQVLSGNIIVDSISTLSLTLDSSTYSGAINPSGTYGSTAVTVNSGSTWTLTGNSYVTSLINYGTINTNGYTLYVNGVAYSA